jgi:hypothetical protein
LKLLSFFARAREVEDKEEQAEGGQEMQGNTSDKGVEQRQEGKADKSGTPDIVGFYAY